MWRSKKFIVIAVLAAVVLVGSIGGVALAQTRIGSIGKMALARTGYGPNSLQEDCHGVMMDRICEIYEGNTGVAIDQQVLEDAFAQARSEMCDSAMESHLQNRDSYLQNLVDQGEITQDEADQYKEAWQARADMPARFGFGGHGGFRGCSGLHAPVE